MKLCPRIKVKYLVVLRSLSRTSSHGEKKNSSGNKKNVYVSYEIFRTYRKNETENLQNNYTHNFQGLTKGR